MSGKIYSKDYERERLPLNIHVVNDNVITVPIGEEWELNYLYAKKFETVTNPLLINFSITIQGSIPIVYSFASFNLHLFPMIEDLVMLKIDPIFLLSQQCFKVNPVFPQFELLITGIKNILL